MGGSREARTSAIGAAAALAALAFPGAAAAAPGDLDPAFGTGGVATIAAGAPARVVATGAGKIVVAGTSDTGSWKVARLAADGKPDPAFSGDGRATVTLPGPGVGGLVGAAAVQSDGKVLIAGVRADDLAVVRLGTDGTLDAGFGTSGRAILENSGQLFGFGWNSAFDLQIDASGKILVTGALRPNATVLPASATGAIVRLNANGSLDTTFGDSDAANGPATKGAALGPAPPNGRIFGTPNLAVAGDGRIYAAGRQGLPDVPSFGYEPAVLRYTAAGLPDTSFGAGGAAVNAPDTASRSLVAAFPLSSGVLAAGNRVKVNFGSGFDDDGFPFLQKLTAAGAPDTSFGPSGIKEIDISPETVQYLASDAVRRSNGTVIVAGSAIVQNLGSPGILVRFTPAGAIDTSFGPAAAVAPLSANVVRADAVPNLSDVALLGDRLIAIGRTSVPSSNFIVGSFQLECSFILNCVVLTVPTPSGLTINTSALQANAPMGILVKRIVGRRLVRVGRVPFGPQPRGKRRIRWNLKVNGKRLPAGRYEITLRAFNRRGRVAELSRPIRITVPAARR